MTIRGTQRKEEEDFVYLDVFFSHNFTVQSAEQDRKTLGLKGFHLTAYTAMWCA
jgi:hypothetical protein